MTRDGFDKEGDGDDDDRNDAEQEGGDDDDLKLSPAACNKSRSTFNLKLWKLTATVVSHLWSSRQIDSGAKLLSALSSIFKIKEEEKNKYGVNF